MKKFLKWFLPFLIAALAVSDYLFFSYIKVACIPSVCGRDVSTGMTMCTADCGGSRWHLYLVAYILIAIIVAIFIAWFKLVSKKQV